MRVLHLVGLPIDTGGVLSVLRNIQEASAGLDLEHVVWVRTGYEETRTPPLDYRWSRWAVGEERTDLTMVASVVPAYRDVRALLRREQFDIVHAHTRGSLSTAVLLGRLTDQPVVFTNHNYANHTGLYRWAARRRGIHTVVLSEDMARHYGLSLEDPRLSVIPACCSDRFFEEPLVAHGAGYTSDRPLRLVGVGMVVPWKGWRTACDALALLDEHDRERVRFDQWGEQLHPEFLAELEDVVTANALERTMGFRGPTDRVADELRAADWLLHPAESDPFPVAVLEALTMGLPVLATDTGGPASMVTTGVAGLHTPTGDAPALADAIRRVLRGEVVIGSSEEIRESVRPMAATAVARRYADLYRSLLPST
jgi:glycosyltransferase involved in cell wall biosynthesis